MLVLRIAAAATAAVALTWAAATAPAVARVAPRTILQDDAALLHRGPAKSRSGGFVCQPPSVRWTPAVGVGSDLLPDGRGGLLIAGDHDIMACDDRQDFDCDFIDSTLAVWRIRL
jgi:hypothetical protein